MCWLSGAGSDPHIVRYVLRLNRRFRLQAHGRIACRSGSAQHLAAVLLHYNILIYVLLASVVVTAALGHVIDTLVIWRWCWATP
jgi:hypothetical protein